MLKNISSKVLILTSFLATSHYTAPSYALNMATIKQDVTYLASDNLKGRASYSAELEAAAKYIANRFKQSGLQPFKGSFLQSFPIYSFQQDQLSVNLDEIDLAPEQLAMASTTKQIHWTHSSDVKTTYISASDNMRKVLSDINQKGGDHLVIIHSSHQELFQRYKNYFERGITKLNNANQGSIVLALSNQENIKTYAVSGTSKVSNKTLSNVVGVIPGTTKADEVVLYSAHYDHLGERPLTPGEDKIFNGADDNASGTTAIMNIAEHFAKQRNNARTLIFAAFTAEEIGGYGSKYFSKHIPATNIVGMINVEMIGKTSKFGSGKMWMTGADRSDLITIMNANLEQFGEEIMPDPYPKEQLFYRSDNATLARLGVPAHSFSTSQLDKDEHYHKASDELATIDFNSMGKVIHTLTLATKSLVDGSATPSRIDTSKVKSSGKIY